MCTQVEFVLALVAQSKDKACIIQLVLLPTVLMEEPKERERG